MGAPPSSVVLWYCPACGHILMGGTYHVDERREKCLKRIHVRTLVPATYTLSKEGKKR